MKTCIACGMPMATAAEHAMGDPEKGYCVHCARPDGSMQSYKEKANSMAGFIVRTQGLDREAALHAAKAMMAKLPAWRNAAN